MSDSVRTAACIVIFHPEIGRLLRSIESVIGQVDEVLLILNSEKKEIEDILRQYSSIVLLGKEENEGIAKAINYAIEYCYAEGIEWLLTLDQDSICPYNLVNRYMDVIDENIGIVTCGIEYNGQMVKTEDQCNDIEECIQSGSFMNVKVANELGGMDSKMFIDQVDFEYCYSGAILDLENSRKENYTSIDGNSLLKKPYGIYTQIIENNSKKEEVFEENLNDEQKSFSLKTFEDDLKTLKGISRSTAKLFRDSYYESESTIEINMLKYGAKNKKQFKKAFTNIAGKQFAEYYDALEMLDIFGTKEGKE